MKIAVISSCVFQCPPPGYSGLEMIAYQCARGLAEKGHEVYLVAPEGSQCPGCQVVSTGPPGHWNEKQAYAGYWEHLLGMDCIIDHSWSKFAYLTKMEGRLKCPVLGVMHAPVNTMYQVWPPQSSDLPRLEKACPVCISKDQAAHFEALHSTPARVCYNGVDMDFYKPIPGVKRTKRFLFLARFSSIKGADLAIQACRQAGVGLDLVGDTSITQEPEYFQQVRGMCDTVHPWSMKQFDGPTIVMVGPATRGETVYWFSQAHCLLHPNQRFREPFGLAPVEAMLCGCPVIAWDYGAMRETVRSGETGALVRSLDEMISQIRVWNGLTKERDRQQCREWASQFSVQAMQNRYDELCREAVETGGW